MPDLNHVTAKPHAARFIPADRSINLGAPRLMGSHLPLKICGGVFAVASLLLVLPLLTDQRLLLDEPIWLKPLKFMISASIYCLTFAWLLKFIEGANRLKSLIAWGTATAMTVEIVIIVFQAWRGERSHFNYTSPLNGALYSTMAIFIGFAWVLNLALAILLFRQRFDCPALGRSLQLATVITLLGAGLGYFMVNQFTDAQMKAIDSSGQWQYVGAHTFGGEDGGAGVPFLGWSTSHGDMRPAHFFGLHAIQVIPILGWWISRLRFDWLESRHRVRLVWTIASGYVAMIVLLAVQALRGQSIVATDHWTLSGYAIIIFGLCLSVVTTITSTYWSDGQVGRPQTTTNIPNEDA